jgi:hypothetical protein
MERKHVQQEQVLKTTIRDMERAQKREGSNLEYLKNIVYKYITTNEHQVKLPVLLLLMIKLGTDPCFGNNVAIFTFRNGGN